MADQKLTTEVEVKGADKGAKDIGKVTAATEELSGKTGASAGATNEATESQQKHNASISDLSETLNRVAPGVGTYVDTLFKGSKIIGDLITQNVSFAGGLAKIGQLLKANAALITAMGAGVAIYLAISRAVRTMREELEAATAAIKAQSDAMTELRQQEQDRKKTLEEIADLRKEGGFGTAAEAEAAGQRAERVRGRAPFLDQQAIMRAVALAGRERGVEDLQRIAFLMQTQRVQVEPGMRPELREAKIARALERFSDVIDKTFAREEQQRGEGFIKAMNQMRTQIGGSLDALVARIEELTAGEGLDPVRLAKAMQFVPQVESEHARMVEAGYFRQAVEALMDRGGVSLGEGGKLTAQEIEALRNLARIIAAQGTRAIGATGTQAPTVVIDNRGARIVGPSARAQQTEVLNGRTRAERAELSPAM
jgi:hypothetical protein